MIPSGQAHLPNSASQWGRFLRRRRCFPHSFSRSSHPKKSGMDAPPHSALRPERAKWKGETPLCFGHLSGNTRKMHLFMLKVRQQQKKGLALWFIEPSLWISIAALHYDSIDTATLDLLAKLNFNVITNLIIDAIFEVKKMFHAFFWLTLSSPTNKHLPDLLVVLVFLQNHYFIWFTEQSPNSAQDINKYSVPWKKASHTICVFLVGITSKSLLELACTAGCSFGRCCEVAQNGSGQPF